MVSGEWTIGPNEWTSTWTGEPIGVSERLSPCQRCGFVFADTPARMQHPDPARLTLGVRGVKVYVESRVSNVREWKAAAKF